MSDSELLRLIAQLDALSARSTCFIWRLDNNKWIDRKRAYLCEIIECEQVGITAYGATLVEAIANALAQYAGAGL